MHAARIAYFNIDLGSPERTRVQEYDLGTPVVRRQYNIQDDGNDGENYLNVLVLSYLNFVHLVILLNYCR